LGYSSSRLGRFSVLRLLSLGVQPQATWRRFSNTQAGDYLRENLRETASDSKFGGVAEQ